MNGLSERLKNPTFMLVFGFFFGLLIGWFVLGWSVAPVKWIDAEPGRLRPDARVNYLAWTINEFQQTNDVGAAATRWIDFGDNGTIALEELKNPPVDENGQPVFTMPRVDPFAVIQFEQVVIPAAANFQADNPVEESGLGVWILACLALSVLLVGIAVAYYMRDARKRANREPTREDIAIATSREAERTDYVATGETPPLSQFMTTYMIGDDLFDDSFSIDSPAGDFMGECGIGIAEAIGAGEPKKVNAFEVWLFDKNDIQTVTKVLMTNGAFMDLTTQERLAAKGEPILASLDNLVELETETLRLVARVVEMAYGDDPTLPPESHFGRITVELAVWSK